MKTYIVAIGNSDDKLSQREWVHYAHSTSLVVDQIAEQVHAKGWALPDSQYQNVVFVFQADETNEAFLRERLSVLAREFDQEAIALMVCDETEMILPRSRLTKVMDI